MHEMCPVGTELFRAAGWAEGRPHEQTDETKIIVDFLQFANALKTPSKLRVSFYYVKLSSGCKSFYTEKSVQKLCVILNIVRTEALNFVSIRCTFMSHFN